MTGVQTCALPILEIDSEKEFKELRENISKNISSKGLLISDKEKVSLALRNVKTVKVVTPLKVNVKDVVASRDLRLDKEALDILEKRLTNGK